MNNSDLIKKYALSYLSKYHSTKKNLERMLRNKMIRMKNLETSEKNNLYKIKTNCFKYLALLSKLYQKKH